MVTRLLQDDAADLVSRMIDQGCDSVIARRMADHYDAGVAECTPRLYRSAVQPALARLGTGLESAAARPGLVVVPTGDSVVGTVEQRRRSATRAGARVELLDGVLHWWMTEDRGRRAAQVIAEFPSPAA